MGIKVAEIDFDNKHYTVMKGYHSFDKREKNKKHRDFYMTDSRYKEVCLVALQQGLTSFRRKDVVVITFRDYNRRSFGILVNLNDKNNIFIITVFRGPAVMDLSKCFIKVQDRINIERHYTLPYMKHTERTKRDEVKRTHDINIDCQEEDKVFLQAMKQ